MLMKSVNPGESEAECLFGPSENIDDYTNNVRAVYALDAKSFPDTSPATETATPSGQEARLGATTLRFIFWEHVAMNEQHVLPLIEGCDVLAEEAVSVNENHHLEIFRKIADRRNDKFNKDLLIPRGPLKQARIAFRRWNRGGSYNDDSMIYGRFVGKLKGAAKLDAGPLDMPEFVKLESAVEIAELNRDELIRSMSSWEALQNATKTYISARAELTKFREQIAKEQIEALVDRYPSSTIGILYGRSHHLLTRMIEREDVVMQRQFAELSFPSPHHGIVTANFVLENVARTGIPLPKSELDRVVLWTIAHWHSVTHCLDISNLDDRSIEKLAGEVSKVWNSSVNYDEPGAEEFVRQRREDTTKIFTEHINAVS